MNVNNFDNFYLPKYDVFIRKTPTSDFNQRAGSKKEVSGNENRDYKYHHRLQRN